MLQEKVRISPLQLIFLIITLIIATADLYVPAFVAREARQDSWLSPIIATVAMLPIVWLHLLLYKQNPGKTLIEICRAAVGKVAGTIIGFSYVFYFLLITWAVIGELGVMLNTAFLPETPYWVFVLFGVLISSYAVSRNMETIARVNEVLLPLGLGAIFLLMLANINEMDLRNFLPFLKNGIIPPLLGALVVMGWLCEIVVVLQFAHFVNQPEKLKKAVFLGLVITGAGLVFGTLIYALFGTLTEVFVMPALEFARYARVGEFLRNFDILIMGIWTTGIYVKIIVFYYASTYAFSQLLHIKRFQSMVFPIGLLTGSLAVASEGRIMESLEFLHYTFPFFSLTMALVIPLLLYVVGFIRKKVKGEG